jgi:hypothetical protein
MLRPAIFWGAAFVLALASSARAQTAEQKPSIEELLHRIDALQHRVEELEAEKHPDKSASQSSRQIICRASREDGARRLTRAARRPFSNDEALLTRDHRLPFFAEASSFSVAIAHSLRCKIARQLSGKIIRQPAGRNDCQEGKTRHDEKPDLQGAQA